MAKQKVQFEKEVYGKVSYPKIVNTEFSELVSVEDTPLAIPDQLTVAEFFEEYDRLFFERKFSIYSCNFLIDKSISSFISFFSIIPTSS